MSTSMRRFERPKQKTKTYPGPGPYAHTKAHTHRPHKPPERERQQLQSQMVVHGTAIASRALAIASASAIAAASSPPISLSSRQILVMFDLASKALVSAAAPSSLALTSKALASAASLWSISSDLFMMRATRLPMRPPPLMLPATGETKKIAGAAASPPVSLSSRQILVMFDL